MAPRALFAALVMLVAAFVVLRYPLGSGWLAMGLGAYAAVLWAWPRLWLIVVPAVLPSIDLTPWTGWLYATESDLVLLVTIGVLALRAPPTLADFVARRPAGWALGLMTGSVGLGTVMGLLAGDHGIASSNPYLQPENALRLAKSLAEALVLLPFLRRALREGGGANLFAWGMVCGLLLVGVASLAERALFVAPFDFSTGYRIVATFSSMHVGGGHIGTYVGMTLPFIAVSLISRRWWAIPVLVALAAIGFYTLVVTFARTAYAAAMVGAVVLAASWLLTNRARTDGRGVPNLVSIVIATIVVGGVALAATRSEFMHERLTMVVPDYAEREANWLGGLAVRDQDVLTTMTGMGIGTFPRLFAERSSRPMHATSFSLEGDDARRYLSLGRSSPLYFGQRVFLSPGPPYQLSLEVRSSDTAGSLTVSVCEKMLLYSDNCRGTVFKPSQPGTWQRFTASLPSTGLGERVVLGFLRRPIEFALHSAEGTVVDVTNIRLVDGQGRDVLVNGDFRSGMARWYFTDDDHPSWRILNLYVSTLFETGVLGLAALLIAMGMGLYAAVQAARRGDPTGAILAASLSSFVFSGLCDNVLEAPRLAAVFYLVLFLAWSVGRPSATNSKARQRSLSTLASEHSTELTKLSHP